MLFNKPCLNVNLQKQYFHCTVSKRNYDIVSMQNSIVSYVEIKHFIFSTWKKEDGPEAGQLFSNFGTLVLI